MKCIYIFIYVNDWSQTGDFNENEEEGRKSRAGENEKRTERREIYRDS